MKVSPQARAIRDVEDEELRSFFYGMAPWQVKNSLKKVACVSPSKKHCMVVFFAHTSLEQCKKIIDPFVLNMLQFILIVAASSVGEELFYRAAVQVSFCMICHLGLLRAVDM